MNGERSSDTVELLRAWHDGDADALGKLVANEMPWLAAHVRRRLGPLLRSRHDTQDIVQEALLGALRDGPRFVVEDRHHLRGLLARIVENIIRCQHQRLTAGRRDVRRDLALPRSEIVLQLNSAPGPFERPSEVAAASETSAWLRLGLEHVDTADRDLIVEREYRGESFASIAAELGTSEDAARMRFRRALTRLGVVLQKLRDGRLGQLLERGSGDRHHATTSGP